MIELEKIRASAEMVVDDVGRLSGMGADFGYNRKSIEWVERYIERLRDSGQFSDQANTENLTAVFGSFLGECLVRNYGGEWRNEEGRWGVYFGGKSAAFPFSRVMKQFQNGLEDGDSILSLYDVVPVMLINGLNEN